MENVYLIGVMGCGKTTMGRILAKKIRRRNVDVDALIEKRMKMTTAEIFAKYGEDFFRDRETEVLEELSQRKNRVVSCGGGIVLREKNIELMRRSGTVIWLRRSADKILKGTRIRQRPLLAENPMRIYDIAKEREPLYEKACHYQVWNEGGKQESLKSLEKVIWRKKK